MKTQTTNQDTKEIVASYLIAELSNLTQRALQYDQEIASKINFFLAIVTAAAIGIVTASDKDLFKPYLLSTSGLILSFLLIIGITTFQQILDLAASSTVFYRRIGRIRRWFLDFDPSIQPYMPFTVADNRPRFHTEHVSLRGIESILMFVNAGISSVLIVLLSVFIFYTFGVSAIYDRMIPLFIAIVGLLIFLAVWLLQVRYVRIFLLRKEERERQRGLIHFPDTKEHRANTEDIAITDHELLNQLLRKKKIVTRE